MLYSGYELISSFLEAKPKWDILYSAIQEYGKSYILELIKAIYVVEEPLKGGFLAFPMLTADKKLTADTLVLIRSATSEMDLAIIPQGTDIGKLDICVYACGIYVKDVTFTEDSSVAIKGGGRITHYIPIANLDICTTNCDSQPNLLWAKDGTPQILRAKTRFAIKNSGVYESQLQQALDAAAQLNEKLHDSINKIIRPPLAAPTGIYGTGAPAPISAEYDASNGNVSIQISSPLYFHFYDKSWGKSHLLYMEDGTYALSASLEPPTVPQDVADYKVYQIYFSFSNLDPTKSQIMVEPSFQLSVSPIDRDNCGLEEPCMQRLQPLQHNINLFGFILLWKGIASGPIPFIPKYANRAHGFYRTYYVPPYYILNTTSGTINSPHIIVADSMDSGIQYTQVSPQNEVVYSEYALNSDPELTPYYVPRSISAMQLQYFNVANTIDGVQETAAGIGEAPTPNYWGIGAMSGNAIYTTIRPDIKGLVEPVTSKEAIYNRLSTPAAFYWDGSNWYLSFTYLQDALYNMDSTGSNRLLREDTKGTGAYFITVYWDKVGLTDLVRLKSGGI